MEEIEDIEVCLKEGLRLGYLQNLKRLNNQQGFESTMIEYTLTEKIAQELERWKTPRSIKIQVEYNATDFLNNAFPAFFNANNDLFSPIYISRQKHISCRKSKKPEDGKMDIAINTEIDSEIRSYIGIEVKEINPPYKKLEADIDRLAQAITEVDSTLTNSIEKCYSVFLVNRGGSKRISSNQSLLNGIQDSQQYI